MEPGAEDGGRPSKKKKFEILDEGWGESKSRAKTTVEGAGKDQGLEIEEQRIGGEMMASEPSENGDTPQGEDDRQGRPPPWEETPVTDHPPLQGVSDHPGVKIRPPTKQKVGGTVTIRDFFQSEEHNLAELIPELWSTGRIVEMRYKIRILVF